LSDRDTEGSGPKKVQTGSAPPGNNKNLKSSQPVRDLTRRRHCVPHTHTHTHRDTDTHTCSFLEHSTHSLCSMNNTSYRYIHASNSCLCFSIHLYLYTFYVSGLKSGDFLHSIARCNPKKNRMNRTLFIPKEILETLQHQWSGVQLGFWSFRKHFICQIAMPSLHIINPVNKVDVEQSL